MRTIKFILLFISMSIYLILTAIVRLIFIANRYSALKAVNALTYYLMHVFIKIGNMQVKIQGQKDILKEKNLFIISTHNGYLDGIVLGTLAPGSFTTKSEIKKVPFLSWVVSMGGSIFIDRNRKADVKSYIDCMADRLINGINVFNFPEGHATDGTKILTFFSAFFNAPLKARSQIVPITIDYTKLNNSSDFDRRAVYCYDGTVSIIRHLWNLMRFNRVDVVVTVHDKIQLNGYEADSRGRKLVSDLCMTRLSKYKDLPIERSHPFMVK